MRDAIVPVLGVAPEISIEPVAHVQEFLGHHHFQRARSRAVDAQQVDQNEILVCGGRKSVRSPHRTPYATSQPAFEFPPVGCDAETVCRQIELRGVSFENPPRFLVFDQPAHDGDLHGRVCHDCAGSTAGMANMCGAESS